MSVTTFSHVDEVNKVVQDFWSPVMMKELRENTLWPGLIMDAFEFMPAGVGRQGEGVPIKGGDKLKVTRINKPSSTVKTIGTDADSFGTSLLSTTQVELDVNKRAVSAYEFEDMGILLSQLESEDSEIRAALLADVKEQINDYIKSLISPSSASPDHVQTSSDFNAATLSSIRKIAAAAKWGFNEPWYLVCDPSYYSDIIDDTTLASADYGAADRPIIQGQIALPRMGFNILEDNSMSTDTAYAFIPSFMLGALAAPRFKISDLHAQKRFGYVISVDAAFGVKQYDNQRVISIAVS